MNCVCWIPRVRPWGVVHGRHLVPVWWMNVEAEGGSRARTMRKPVNKDDDTRLKGSEGPPHSFPGFAFLHVHYHGACESHWAIARSEPTSGRRALVSGCTPPNLIQQLLCTASPATWDLFGKDCFLTSLSKAGRLLHGLLAPKPANSPKRPHYSACFPKKGRKKRLSALPQEKNQLLNSK